MKPVRKKILLGLAAVGTLAALSVGIYAYRQVSAFDASMAQVYSTPLPNLGRSTDPAVVARGKHLVESLGACATRDCHSSDLGGGKTLELGPPGTLSAPNITAGGFGGAYSDGELARLLRFESARWPLCSHDAGARLRLASGQRCDSDDFLPAHSAPASIVQGPDGRQAAGKDPRSAQQVHLRCGATLVNAKPTIPAPHTQCSVRSLCRATLCSGCHDGAAQRRTDSWCSALPSHSAQHYPHESGIKDWTYPDFEKSHHRRSPQERPGS